MSAWLAMLLLVRVWWVAATTPTAERVEVTVTTSSGEAANSDFSIWFSPWPFDLQLAIGPLGVESGSNGVWAAHRLDPSTVAVLTDQPVGSLVDLADYLPPTPMPTVALALARPDSPWEPLDGATGLHWSRFTLLTQGVWVTGLRLRGTCDSGEIEAVLRRGKLESVTLEPTTSARANAVSRIEVGISRTDLAEPVQINRGATRVSSLFSLRALGPAIEPGQRLPRGIQISDAQATLRLEDLPWGSDAGLRLLVFVPSSQAESQVEHLVSIDAAIATAARATGVTLTPVALADGPGSDEARSRVRALVDQLGTTQALRGVYALNEQHRLIYRLRPAGHESGPIGVLIDDEGVVLVTVPMTGTEAEVSRALIGVLESDPARGR